MRRWRERLADFGPGLVFLLASVGAEDLVTNSAAGMNYGYSLLWTLPLILAARFVTLEASARYVVVTGESLVEGCCRVSRWVSWLLLGAIFIRLHLHNLGALLLIGEAAHILAPLPVGASATIWSVLFWTVGFAVAYRGGYRQVERWFRPLLFVLAGSLLAAAVLAKPDPVAVVRGLFIPSIPANGGVRYALVLMALAGAGASSLGNLKYAAFVHEKGWRDISFLRPQRTDLLLSVAGLLTMATLIQVAATTWLGKAGASLETAEDLASLFTQAFGRAGAVVFGLGLLSAVFTTFVGVTTGYSLLVADLWRNLAGRKESGGGPAGQHPAYRWCVVWFCVSPLYVFFTDWKPVWLILASSALLVVVTPLIVLVVLRLTNDKARMGKHSNRWQSNAALRLVLVVAVYLTGKGAISLWEQLQRSG